MTKEDEKVLMELLRDLVNIACWSHDVPFRHKEELVRKFNDLSEKMLDK